MLFAIIDIAKRNFNIYHFTIIPYIIVRNVIQKTKKIILKYILVYY